VRRFRELLDWDEAAEAVQDAAQWGYPRLITSDEVEMAYWYRWSPDCIFWFNCTDTEERVFSLHVVVAPQSKGLMFPRRWAIAVEIIGELIGAKYLEAQDCCPGMSVVDNYMPRLGWELVEGSSVWRRELPDGSV
jgi:hypothetical protein